MSNENPTSITHQFTQLSLPKGREETIAYLWADNIQNKPLIRETPLDNTELLQLIQERELINKDAWNENDHIAISNLLVGRSIAISMNAPSGPVLEAFAHRLEVEAMASLRLQELLDPSYLLIHTLPDQANNGVPGSLHFTYPTWPPGRVNAAGSEPSVEGIAAVASNVPQEWPLLLHRANSALYGHLCLAPIIEVGAPNALVGYGATPDFPFFLAFRNEEERSIFLAYVRGYLEGGFGNIGGTVSYSTFSSNTAAVRYV
eukprot:gene31235-35258_t